VTLFWKPIHISTLHAKLSGAVYCYWSCLCACNGHCLFVGLLPW